MVTLKARPGCALAAILVVGGLPTLARAQATSLQLGEFTVTADRIEEPVSSTGSDVTVIPGPEVEKWGANGVTEVLREAVGTVVTPTGGPNTQTSVSLRGSDPSQTLVMIDGVPIGNPAATDGSLDFSNLSAIDIDRIEIVRGPQSALYGSDAMGGVINIITKKAKKGEKHTTLTLQGGSYGTVQGTATTSGATDNWTYALGVTDAYTEGFPTYGFRINRPLFLSNGLPLPPLPSIMPANKGGATGNLTYTINPNASIDFGFDIFENNLQYSNPYALMPVNVFSPGNNSTTWIYNGFVRANVTTGLLTSHLRWFANQTYLATDNTEACFDAVLGAISCTSYYRGSRYGVEYEGDIPLPLGHGRFRRAKLERDGDLLEFQSAGFVFPGEQRHSEDQFDLRPV
jgi:vitamin B12 transporter